VDRGGRSLSNIPAEIYDRRSPVIGPPAFLRLDLRVDVAVVGVVLLHLLGRLIPLGPAERPRPGYRRAGRTQRTERIQGAQLLGREAAISLDVEGANSIDRAFVDS